MFQTGYSRGKKGKFQRSVEYWARILTKEKQTTDPFSEVRAVSFVYKTQLKEKNTLEGQI